VLRHPGRTGDANAAPAGKAVEGRIEQRGENLAHAVGAEIEAEDAVTVSHAAVIAHDRRYDELIADVALIGIDNDCAGACEARPLGFHNRVVGLCYAIVEAEERKSTRLNSSHV